ncbi:MAG: DNA-directed RNA polymerase subunit beta [Candidatus Omnitrophica bacterium]|nr:DNA-directed RNA polymerase subunit beta [Candidatus Omnitrophota bacterium]MBU1924867.1 DNA-directed RNA polymerase subunit beta [Candidatus Omnitrophota bacterium]
MIKRKSYAKLEEVFDPPHLLQVQLDSYAEFLQLSMPKTKRENVGLQAVFNEVFPMENFEKTYLLEYVNYTLDRPKYEVLECQRRCLSYASPLKVKLRLRTGKDVKEQEVYLGELPLMTDVGTFVVNGDERVVVSQLHRSPGLCFEHTIHTSGKKLYSARIIPYRGAWVEFEFDHNDVIYVYIDRRRKFYATTFLRAIGYSSNTDILKLFYPVEEVKLSEKSAEEINALILAEDVPNPKDKVNSLVSTGTQLNRQMAEQILDAGLKQVKCFITDGQEILNTLERDRTTNKEEALFEIYRRLRPGDPVTIESAQILIERLIFDHKRYDLGRVGRFVLNRKLEMKVPLEMRALDNKTIIAVIKSLIKLKNGEGKTDDIDHLGNRRVRTVGELVQNQFRIGLARMERSVRERMGIYDMDSVMPHNLVNSKLVSSVIKDFFGRSQLSQFMDQTNPLSELTHKRRLSALGPGGLSRERAGFEVRDVHYSHYGRICPIETPEGPNIGLIASLTTFSRINEFGFIETPYRKVVNGKVTDKIEYLSADIEDQYVIAQANAPIDKSGRFINDLISCRYKGDFPKMSRDGVNYMDVSPRQIVSVAASLIPFLEHDDANRALMGSNMQRQAVPLLDTEAPLVGTGMEAKVARDTGAIVICKSEGVVKYADAKKIIIDGITYNLQKFSRSNASTCINQRLIVKVGQKIKRGQVIADGAGTKDGELGLGRNVLVAFMPWRGYNFEDAILISEKVIKEDIYTSVHIEEFECEARDTRLGNEEITCDIPNIGEESLKDLGEDGIVRIGAEVSPGDILVGKVTPKSETELSPEEKLLRAIFGEKAQDVKDTSLTVPPGIEGVIIDVRVFTRKGVKGKSKEQMGEEVKEANKIRKYYSEQIKKLKQDRNQKLYSLLLHKKLAASLLDEETGAVLIPANKTVKKKDIKKIDRVDLDSIKIADKPEVAEKIKKIIDLLDDQIKELIEEQERELERVKRGDELPPGVLKKVIVLVAGKKKLSVGDKMAGRHGNKGVIARILPEEDMPFLPDGTPVEIVLNPLGVPSRMNVGQILETHLGWAAKVLGFRVASSVFDGCSEAELRQELKAANLPEDGKIVLRDGFTGMNFDQKVSVGYIYMVKLAHLVDDKIHARSIGPYSLVTQQPLGGKAQFGGQRFGEMEVWALEAYGAAFTLQELLTVKSDDVIGRTRIYESIVKGENALNPSTPESFNVLVKELQSLALDVRTESKTDGKEKPEKKRSR